jgi:hypothetical protein
LYFYWKDYNLIGPPTLSYDDYTFQALGLDNLFQQIIEKIGYSEEIDARIKWRLIGYWGIGKSTFIYNLCYRSNELLFFGDCIEKPNVGKYGHVLSLFVNTPRKRSELLENTFENGLPFPWNPDEGKSGAETKRKILLNECIRKIAFLLLRKALDEAVMRGYIFRGLSIGRQTQILSQLRRFKNLTTRDFALQVDKLAIDQKLSYRDLEYVIRDYIRLRCHTGEKRIISEKTDEWISRAIYPINSPEYVEAFQTLVGEYARRLRHFDTFQWICRTADISILLAIDEVEDWSTVVKHKLDLELLDMIISGSVSLVLVFRTEVMKRIRRQSVLYRYLSILQHLEDIPIPELKTPQIIEITKAVLSTARLKKEWTLYPFSENFVTALASKAKRGGKFNIRIYLRALTDILQKSLTWKRNVVELVEQTFITYDAKSVIDEVIIHEICKEKESAAMDEEKFRKFEVALAIAQRLLVMQNPPKDRLSLEALKAEFVRSFKAKTPSDMEIIASVDDKAQREKLQRLIEIARVH